MSDRTLVSLSAPRELQQRNRTDSAASHRSKRHHFRSVEAQLAILTVLVASIAQSCAGAQTPATTLGVNDVSLLFPLPRNGAELGLLPMPNTAGMRGTLLPRAIYDQLPLLLAFGGPTTVYGALRVVGVRVDPCFPGLGPSGPVPCQAQLRLVFQPMTAGFDGDPTVSTDDAALHAFYALSTTEIVSVARALAQLRSASNTTGTEEPLGPHPVMQREGLAGSYAAGLRMLLQTYAGQQNLTRVTFMTLERVNARWRFGGFDIAPTGALTPMVIPTSGNATEQVFFNADTTGAQFDQATVAPASTSPQQLSFFYNSTNARAASTEAQQNAYRNTLALEHPERHSPDTVDCVTCHTATPARVWAERSLGLRPSSDAFTAGDAFASTNEGAFTAITLRAFGYFARRPSISRRTVNESVVVARALNQMLR